VVLTPESFTALGPGRQGRIARLDGSQVAHAGTTREFDLGANEVAVWML